MKFALHNASFLPTTGNLKDVWPELRERALWMEANGFDYLSVMDHLWQIPGVGSSDEPFMEGWMTLAALAEATQRLQLTTLVTGVGYRNPALVVKMVTTLDLISGGRAILGIGGGWYKAEYDAYGYGAARDFPRPGIRLRQLREAVQMAKILWREPRATYEGRHFFLKDAILEPKPLQQPRPRIMVGGGGEKVTLRIVAEEADMCNFGGGGPKAFARKLDILRKHCQDVGRDMAEIEPTLMDRVILAPSRTKADDKWKAQGARERDGYRGLTGTPDDVVKLLREYEEVGVQGLFLMIPNADAESRELLAKEVIPAFK
jgi:F420-dependent oxidoreductase-like protein